MPNFIRLIWYELRYITVQDLHQSLTISFPVIVWTHAATRLVYKKICESSVDPQYIVLGVAPCAAKPIFFFPMLRTATATKLINRLFMQMNR